MTTRLLSFPHRNAVQVSATTPQLLKAKKIWEEEKAKIALNPEFEYMFWVDERTIVAFKNGYSKFWEVVKV